MNMSLNFRSIIIAIIGIIVLPSFQSCSDDESYDVTGNPTNKVFVNTQGWSPINTPKNSFVFEVVHTPEGDFGNILAKFPIRSTGAISSATTVKVELDNSLIEAYNQAHNTQYAAFPTAVLNLNRDAATIATGEYISADSISISVDQSKLGLLTEKAYLVPVKLASVSGSNAEIASSQNIVYIIATTSVRLIKYNVASTAMLGSLVSSYSGWEVSADVTVSSGTYSNIFDASTTTYWTFSASPATIVIDMKENKNVSGLRLFARNATSTSNENSFNNVVVSLSEDNLSYNNIGTVTNSTMVKESGYQYIGFYRAVSARYIKLSLGWSTTTRAIADLRVYVN